MPAVRSIRMKALMYIAPEKVELQDVPLPELKPHCVNVRITATGICGSDVHGFLGHSPRRLPGLILGHEAVAKVHDVHATVNGWSAGDRVVINLLVSCMKCAVCLSGMQNLCAHWWLIGMDRV